MSSASRGCPCELSQGLCIARKPRWLLVLHQERVYSRIEPWLVLEESTNPEVVAQRISMLFGERFLEQLTQACLGKCRELPAMQTSVYQVVEQLRQRFTPQELSSIAMMLSAEMGYQQYQRQRW